MRNSGETPRKLDLIPKFLGESDKLYSTQNNIVLWMVFIILPLTYTLPIARDILMIVILLLVFFLFTRGGGINQVLHITIRQKNTTIINIFFCIQICWFLLVTVVLGFQLDCITRIVQMIGCFLAFYLGANLHFTKQSIETVQKYVNLILVVAFFCWGIVGFPLTNYGFFYKNANTFSCILLGWLLFSLLGIEDVRRFIVIALIGMILLAVTASRGALLAFFVYLLSLFFLNKEKKRGFKKRAKKKWQIVFFVLIILIGMFVVIYVNLPGTELGDKLQIVSLKHTGKNFFSGRDKLWGSLIEAIKEKPVMGYGLDALPKDFVDVDISSHNTFIQVALQSGLVGLMLLIMILKHIHANCIQNYKSDFSIFSIAIMYAMIIYNSFEVILTQNFMVVGLEIWLMLGMGCMERGID